LSFRFLGNGRHFAGLSAVETGAFAGADPVTAILAKVVSWPAWGTHATCTLDGLARRLFAVRAVNTSDRLLAVTVTSPAAVAVTGGAEPDAVSVRRPLREAAGDLEAVAAGDLEAVAAGDLEAVAAGELEMAVVGDLEMAVAGDLRSRQITATCLVPSVTLVLRLAVSVTAAAFSRARSATAARGRVTAIPVPVGWIGWPAVPAAGNVAVTSVLTGSDAEGNAQV